MSTFLWLVLIGGVLMILVYPVYVALNKSIGQWLYMWRTRKSALSYPCDICGRHECPGEDCLDCYR